MAGDKVSSHTVFLSEYSNFGTVLWSKELPF